MSLVHLISFRGRAFLLRVPTGLVQEPPIQPNRRDMDRQALILGPRPWSA